MNGRVVTSGWRRFGAAALSACALVAALPSMAAGGTHGAAVSQAEGRLRDARAREAALATALDQMADGYERAQAHQLRLEEELVDVERGVSRARAAQVAARESLRRRVTAAYRAPHTDLALATAVLDAPDAATAIHRAGLMSRLAVHAAHELTEVREDEQRARAGLRQRRILESGAEAAARTQREEAERLVVALAQAAEEVSRAQDGLELARRRAKAAAAEAARRASIAAPGPLPVIDGKVCPVAGPNGFIDSWGFPRSGGRRHQGVDMFAEYGTALAAVGDGVVRRVFVNRLGGLSVDLVDTEGNRYYYAHLSAVAVTDGQRVSAGDVVGAVGTSGNARGTPPHLHWQFHPDDGPPVNPYPLARTLCR